MTLYVVPAVALNFPREFVGGAVLALLVLAYLRLDRLPLGDAAGAGSLALGAALVALAAAPVLDRDRPLWDYESWASDTASAGTVAFSWDHDYGPLDWPRDGREMLRIKARRAAYWKAEQLDLFDGERWRATTFGRGSRFGYEVPGDLATVERFTERVQVNVRNLRTQLFITAGVPSGPPRIGRTSGLPTGMPGIYVSRRQLATGDTYTFSSYVPEPRTSVLAAPPPDYASWLDRYQRLSVDALVPGSGQRTRWGVRSRRSARTASPRPSSAAASARTRSPARASRCCGARSSSAPGSSRSGWGPVLDAVAVRPARRGLPQARVPLHGDAAGRRAHARRLPVRRQGRLLPAVLGRDGAPAAHGRRPGAGRDRVQPGLLRPRRQGVGGP